MLGLDFTSCFRLPSSRLGVRSLATLATLINETSTPVKFSYPHYGHKFGYGIPGNHGAFDLRP